ncbi:hypothetical protein [Nocardiopsis sp. CNS-639]|uniref:hypothetical protein n=1 Tax=Nocardiopsis sp. CNS-639 TaxID=1169153 RepID=UPI00036DECAE|nr:hypothetical protein [Nocardiopsis sp. CNS-639]
MSAPGPAVPTTTDRAVTLADNAEPSVAAGRYTIDLAQEISGKDGTGKDFRTPFRAPQQAFHVHGPRFALDPSVVHTGFPNPGSTGDFSFVLPHVVLTDPTLPWQRTMKEGERFPWMALLVLHESELPDSALTPDGARPQPAATLVLDKEGKRTYSESGTALPDLPYEPIPEGVTNCRTVDLPAAVFVDLTPRLGELAPLAHVQRTITPSLAPAMADPEVPTRGAVLLSNRLPRSDGRYIAHLVSLEGFTTRLDGRKPPSSTGQPEAERVRLISLWSSSFVSRKAAKATFATVAKQIADNSSGRFSLRLPHTVSGSGTAQAHAQRRIDDGFVPVNHHLPDGSTTVGWYRGPCVPATPRPLPDDPRSYGRESDALVHLPEHGCFDVSYASAFALGRVLALADPAVAKGLLDLCHDGLDLAHALARHPDALKPLPGDGEPTGAELAEALGTLRRGNGADEEFRRGLVPHVSPALLSADSSAPAPPLPDSPSEAVKAVLDAPADSVAGALVRALAADRARDLDEAGLGFASLIRALPFDHVVPDARMLPPDSARVFVLDPRWFDAVAAGAVATGTRGAPGGELGALLLERLREKVKLPEAGMFVRSALVRDWPGLAISATRTETKNGDPVDVMFGPPLSLAPDLLLLTFTRMPTDVVLREPGHALSFGPDGTSNGRDFLNLRYLKAEGGKRVGETIDKARLEYGRELLRTRGESGRAREVLRIGTADAKEDDTLVKALRDRLHKAGQCAKDDALPTSAVGLQLLNSPCQLVFSPKGVPAPVSQPKESE